MGRIGPWRLLLLRLFLLLTFVSEDAHSSMLSVPRNYTIFEGPLYFIFTASPVSLNRSSLGSSSTVQLVSTTDNNNMVVATANIPTGYDEAEMAIACGTIDVPGLFRFRLVDQDGVTVLEESDVTYVSWPRVAIALPMQHRTLSGELTLRVTSSGVMCDSMNLDSTYSLEVHYLGHNESQTTYRNRESTHIVYNETLRTLIGLNDVPLTLPCSQVDQSGIYQAVLRSSRDPDHPIAVSNPLDVPWNESYGLVVKEGSLYPCDRHVTVHYSQPQCPGADDKIRLYRQTFFHVGGGMPVEPRLEYVMEMKAKTKASSTGFQCSRFNSSVPGYCFKYVSVARNRAVHEQRITCLPTHPEESVDGTWSSWSEWSPCVGCGAKRRRFRTCDSLQSPSSRPFLPFIGSRAHCQGSAFDQSTCSEPRCPDAAHAQSASTETPMVTSDPLCACGCSMTKPEDHVVSSTGCQLPALWRIEVSEGQVIRLTFDRFDLGDGRTARTWVRVRDGHSQLDSLLVNSYGGLTPAPVMSTQNRMMVEYQSGEGGPGLFGTKRKEGFVATYTAIVDDGLGHRPDRKRNGVGSSSHHHQVIWESAVTVAGISLCVLIVIVSVGFVCHHHIVQRRRMKAKLL